MLYVNAANVNLTDGAGQALSFRNRFKKYDTKISKPLTTATTFTVQPDPNNGGAFTDLCLCVGHDNTTTADVKATNDAMRTICKDISAYASKNGLTVLMPLVGTDLFKGSLCCLKRHLRDMHCHTIMQFYTKKIMQRYHDTPLCTHGGYVDMFETRTPKTITVNISPQQISPAFESIIYERLDDHMSEKIDDIIDYYMDKHDLDAANNPGILEYSAAPGHFAQQYNMLSLPGRYVTCHYKPGWAMKHAKADYTYNNVGDLIMQLKPVHLDNIDFVIDDDPINSQNVADKLQFQTFCLTKNIKSFFYKIMFDEKLYKELVDRLVFTSSYLHIFRNDGTRNVCGEQYIFISSTSGVEVHSEVFDPIVAQKLIDDESYKQQKNTRASCKCKLKLIPNTLLTAKVPKESITKLLQLLIDEDPVLSNSVKLELQELIFDDIDIEVHAVSGVGGSGKTMDVINSTCSNCTIVVSPYSRAKKDIQKIAKLGNNYANTHIAVINNRGHQHIRQIILDEVYVQNFTMIAIYKILWPDVKFYGTGDPKQITWADWDGTLIVPKIESKGYNLTTKRNPKSVTDLFAGYIPGIVSSSKTKDIVKYVPERTHPDKKDVGPHDTVITFTKNNKEFLSNLFGYNVFTAGESHGRTLERVHLCYTDIKQMPEEMRPRQLYTAISRVSRELVVYGINGDEDIKVTLQGSALERALDATDTPFHDTVEFIEKPLETAMFVEETIRIKPPAVDKAAIESVLQRIYVTSNNLPPDVVDLNPNSIPQDISKRKYNADVRFFESYDHIVHAKKLSQFRVYNRLYTNMSIKKAASTQLSRYAKRANKPLSASIEDRFMEGLETWLRPNYKTLAKLHRPTSDQIISKLCESLRVLQTKFPKVALEAFTDDEREFFAGFTHENHEQVRDYASSSKSARRGLIINDDVELKPIRDRRMLYLKNYVETMLDPLAPPSKYLDLENEFTTEFNYHKQVKFHMKQQPKNIMNPGFDAEDKAGQGVSAWTKMANIVCAGFIRCFDEILPLLLKDNVQLAYNSSDADLSTFFCKYADKINDRQYIKWVNDFGEFDCSQEQRGITVITKLYKLFGVSDAAANFMMSMRAKWTMTMTSKSPLNTSDPPIRAILEGVFQMHSGMIHTLGANTLYNMAALGLCFKFSGVICASFKGDDSFVLCRSVIERTDHGVPIWRMATFKMKTATPDIAEYIANIISPWGFIPDLMRRVSRILSKMYQKKDDWEQIKLSTADALSVINEENLEISMMFLEKFYINQGVPVNHHELTDIYFYLKQLVKSDTDVLGIPVDLLFLERFQHTI